MSTQSLSHVSYATPNSIIAVGAIFPILSIFAVILRFYTRYVQKAALLVDDWLTLPAMVSVIVTCPRTFALILFLRLLSC